MRLATLRDGTRDGALLVVGRDGKTFARAAEVVPSLQAALDDWPRASQALASLAARLDKGEITAQRFDEARLGPPLPRAYEWIDASAFLNHVRLVRKARNATPPPTLEQDPLIYQGGSGVLLGPRDDLHLGDPDWGLDFESEVAVILGDVARGTSAAQAPASVRLVLLANDVTLRNLVPGELAKGFGFFQSKPATAFSPFAVTPDELGQAWRGGRLHLPLRTTLKRAGGASHLCGDPEAGTEMHFSFFDLVAHAARTRALTAGTILGSGTVSNADPARGVSCLAELRAREMIAGGVATTPFLAAGDAVAIEMRDADGRDIFGRIAQRVVSV
ncbi:MAG TPA: fumarylacetoacetate hydrolase family protein [Polyangia bacterium]|nr:fumarylacetoacetate hydrolase family protein [Polyangia bacterium]